MHCQLLFFVTKDSPHYNYIWTDRNGSEYIICYDYSVKASVTTSEGINQVLTNCGKACSMLSVIVNLPFG